VKLFLWRRATSAALPARSALTQFDARRRLVRWLLRAWRELTRQGA